MAADPITSATVDDLFNGDLSDFEDPFADKPADNSHEEKENLSPLKRKAGDDENTGDLGVEQEVKIVKKRKPIAKLDDTRLLSKPGIPKLRELVRSSKPSRKLRLKGKGHEFSDVSRLLNYYQLWLDNLYPRAKFADGLQIIEKVGHSKRMQVMRKQWIDEGKPGYARDTKTQEKETDDLYTADDLFGNGETLQQEKPAQVQDQSNDLFLPDSNAKTTGDDDVMPSDDELDALLAENAARGAAKPAAQLDSEGEDDLDALLAEHESRPQPQPYAKAQAQPSSTNREDDIPSDDELEAILAEQEARSTANHIMSTSRSPVKPRAPPPANTQPESKSKRRTTFDDSDDDDEGEDDLDALLAEQQERMRARRSSPRAATPQAERNQPTVEDEGEIPAEDLLSSPIRASQGDLPALAEDEHGEGGNGEESQTKQSETANDARMMFSSSPLRDED